MFVAFTVNVVDGYIELPHGRLVVMVDLKVRTYDGVTYVIGKRLYNDSYGLRHIVMVLRLIELKLIRLNG